MDFRDIDKELQIEFASKKIKAEQIASMNLLKAKSSSAFVKLTEIEREISFEISKLKSNDKSYKELKNNLEETRKQKSLLLKKLGLSDSSLSPNYSCKICNDSGFFGGKMCECYKKRRNEKLIKVFGLEIAKENTFAKFSTKICKDAKQAEELFKLKNILEKWANSYPNILKKNIIISGETGVGKTYLTSCLANEFLANNYSVCFVSAFSMNEAFLKYHTSFDANKSAWLEPFLDSDLLIIDDLGTEPNLKNVTQNYLYLVLSERERFGKPVIITTNLLPVNILDRYNERVYSRLANKKTSNMIHVSGTDLRIAK